MEAPFLFITTALAIGIIASRYYINLAFIFALLLISVSISIFLYIKRKNATKSLLISFIFLGFILGSNAMSSTGKYLNLQNKIVTLKGTVSNLKIYDGYAKYVVEPVNAPKVLINQYGGDMPTNGDYVSINGVISIPKPARNPGGFDYSIFLKKNGIEAVMSIQGYEVNIIGKSSLNPFQKIVQALRERIEKNYINSMPEQDAKFIISIILGNNVLDDDILNQFRTIGISHIISVSGMHVAVIIGFIMFILGLIKIKRYKVPIVTAIIVFYAILTGGMPPVVRSVIMASTALIGSAVGRNNNPVNSISFAAFVILIANPLMLYDIGFQLSFISTLAILYFYKPVKERLSELNSKLRDLIAVTIAAQIGTIPLTMYYFHSISVVSILSNIIIVPITDICVILGFLSAILGLILPALALIINYANIPVVEIILYITKLINSIPYASINTVIPPLYIIVLYYAILIIAFSGIDKKLKLRLTFAVLLIVALISIYNYVPKNLEVTFLDVGQGDSTFIRTPNRKALLIDGGGKPAISGSSFDVGHDIVLPFLYYKGVLKLDGIFISHTDTDHIGGILSLIKEIKVDKIFIGEQKVTDDNFKALMKIAALKNIPVVFLSRGDEIKVDNVVFDVLSPGEFIEENPINNNALVFKVVYKNAEFLFTGDIEKEAEEKLGKSDISSDVLKVAHHGSNTSSTRDFINKVKPKICVIQVGKNNYGQPDADVLKYLNSVSKVYRTDEDGAIIIKTDGNKFIVNTMFGK